MNLERALRVGDFMGGHFVSGHVDGVAVLAGVRYAGRDKVLRFKSEADILDGMIIKGSVACDGVSLTISNLSDLWFEVNVIPFTAVHTTLGNLVDGDVVNIETDMFGKYVRQYTKLNDSTTNKLDYDHLRMAGFID